MVRVSWVEKAFSQGPSEGKTSSVLRKCGGCYLVSREARGTITHHPAPGPHSAGLQGPDAEPVRRMGTALAVPLKKRRLRLFVRPHKSWDWPVGGPGYLSCAHFFFNPLVCFLMAIKVCTTLLEVGNNAANGFWIICRTSGWEGVSRWAGGLPPGEKDGRRLQGTFQRVRASAGGHGLPLGRRVGFQIHLQR